MSADNYTICPQCHADKQQKQRELEGILNSPYINVPIEEFKAIQDEIKNSNLEPLQDTLKEYYTIGIKNGKFIVNYGCVCQVCGFEFVFTHRESVITGGGE